MRWFFRQFYHLFLSLLPGRMALSILFFRAHRRWPSLRHPRSFNEKVQWRKLYDHDPRYPKLADKIAVKEFVSSRLGAEWVTPTLWFGNSLPPRSERRWPIPYVLKASHGSSTNYFVRTTSEEDWSLIEKKSGQWLQATYGDWTREWLYTKIPPRLLVEPFLGSPEALPLDYKFFVFAGRVAYIQVDTDREHNHKRVLFDRAWNRCDVTFGVPQDTTPIARPVSLEQMITAAETLGQGFDFVRIDFYEILGRPLFGEMTFYPDSGLGTFSPEEFDRTLGALWKIS